MTANGKDHSAAPKPTTGPVTLLLGTIKGAFTLTGDGRRDGWKVSKPTFLGAVVNHVKLDPRDGKTMMMAAKTGHLGPTVYRSADGGKNWKEATRPPAFPKVPEGQKGKTVNSVFFVTPGHASEPNVWYAGTIPFGLFRSEDAGATWDGVKGFNEGLVGEWPWGPDNSPPGGPFTHSLLIDPRNARHMYISCSTGGFFETVDKGASWKPLNKGVLALFMPEPEPEIGQDPHSTIMHPIDPDLFWQQNHCGIYRLERKAAKWDRVGNNMPKKIGDIGFAIAAHPRERDTAWVFPMDGTDVWPRTSPHGKPAAFVTKNGGKTWKRQNKGFPRANAYFTVFRQGMATDTHNPVGLYIGTTNGELWASRNGGEAWKCIARHLPRILSVEVVEKRK